jgi:hypothetical protein
MSKKTRCVHVALTSIWVATGAVAADNIGPSTTTEPYIVPSTPAEKIVKLIAVACERPQDCGRPITRWSSRELAAEVVKRGIVKTIARSTLSQLLKEAKIKPHLSRYWLNARPEDEAAFDAQVRAICALYRQATLLSISWGFISCLPMRKRVFKPCNTNTPPSR